MTAKRMIVAAVGVLLTALPAWPQCPSPVAVDLTTACVGEPASGSASFCFAPALACIAPGIVRSITAPDPPFAIAGIHVDGPFGTRVVTPADFPVALASGESITVDLTAVLATPGALTGRLGWVVSDAFADNASTCDVQVTARSPACAPPTVCGGETCVAGTCVPVPVTGPCQDGDPCTVGDTCVGGVCQPGPRTTCPQDNPCAIAFCNPAGGCTPIPLTGPPCDDGDACTVDDRCEAGACRGTPRECPPDGLDCTADQCIGGACQVPQDARCGSDECTAGACRPGDPAADARGCVSVPVGEGEACTDDGVACTDDLCTAGACLHVPVDGRCASGDACVEIACAPDRPDRDARGCATGPPPPKPAPPQSPASPGGGDKHKSSDGGAVAGALATACPEDGDPCTDDVCQNGHCTHPEVLAAAACAPVRAPFEKARGLAALSRNLMSGLQAAPSASTSASGMAAGVGRLGRAAGDLDGAALALAGRVAPAPAARSLGFAETPAQQRAHIAFTRVLHTPREVQAFLALVNEARTRAALRRDTASTLRRRGRLLLRGTKTLKGDLKRLQQVSQTFAR